MLRSQLAVLVICSLACSGNQLGPCVIIPQEPVLFVTRVQNGVTGALLPQVRLRSISIDSRPIVDPRELIEGLGVTPKNVTAVGVTLICDIECAFGVESGRYLMTVGAAGYRDSTIALTAKYASSTSRPGGCPTLMDDGTRIAITLMPQ